MRSMPCLICRVQDSHHARLILADEFRASCRGNRRKQLVRGPIAWGRMLHKENEARASLLRCSALALHDSPHRDYLQQRQCGMTPLYAPVRLIADSKMETRKYVHFASLSRNQSHSYVAC
ncbi:hypothetical protein CB0940_07861 [Cercospora beticola]|uniref:Uncharacterized protein n=1 Tax=Cercospora beticola TaxID=122368 RepID=A0A2G5HAL7_CERBT|nr:hypothetical protein CB0940_07861 [Cercospora beticola]PIA89272.1 hypothetical protein CB0940_07861 [Cercospora beticola]